MSPMETEFAIKIALVFVSSLLIFSFMRKLEREKQKRANEAFDLTIKMIEMRNRKYGDKNEGKD
jgi:hypothetical protein